MKQVFPYVFTKNKKITASQLQRGMLKVIRKMYSQEDINRAIIYRHRLCNRLLELIGDVQVLDKATLLGLSDNEVIALGHLLTPVNKKIKDLRIKHQSLSKELDRKIESRKQLKD